MTIYYACFDEHTDEYCSIGIFTSEEDADIAAREHGLPEDGTEWYVSRAVPVLVRGRLTYEPEPPIDTCRKCSCDLYLNDWIWDGLCMSCAHDAPSRRSSKLVGHHVSVSNHSEKCHEYWDRGLDCPCIPEDVKQAIRDGANPDEVM